MTRATATGTVLLPFSLNICAVGDKVEPLNAQIGDCDVTIQFPASMTEGTVGRSLYPDGYAWWVTDRLHLSAEALIDELGIDVNDTAALRNTLLDAINIALRRFLNAYRWRLHQPQVHSIVADPAVFLLELIHADGTRDQLPEPFDAFFYKRTPSEPPLDRSINLETLPTLQRDVQDALEPPHTELFALDVAWLKSIGEERRADELGRICELPE